MYDIVTGSSLNKSLPVNSNIFKSFINFVKNKSNNISLGTTNQSIHEITVPYLNI